MSKKILFVDDDSNLLFAVQRALRKQFAIDTALGGTAGLRQLAEHGPYAVVVADMQMPRMNGIEFLKQVETRCPDTIRVMLTGNADQKTAVDAVNSGHVFRFLRKPCEVGPLSATLQAALRQHQLVFAEREILEKTLHGAVKILTEVLSTLDPRAFGEREKLRDSMRAFIRVYPVPNAWELELAAMLAAIGRVSIPATVILKERAGLSLTVQEKEMLGRVPEVGARLLETIPRLENVARIVRFQAKNFDGTGLPSDLLSGDQIPIGARVLRLLNDLADLEASGLSKSDAFVQIERRGGYYDPDVINAACQCFDVVLPIVPTSSANVRLKDLLPGQILAQDLKTPDDILILAAGSKITPLLLARIRNFRELNDLSDDIPICA